MIYLYFNTTPVAFQRPRFFSHGFKTHGYNTPKYTAFKNDIQTRMKWAWKEPPMEGPIELELWFHVHAPQRGRQEWPGTRPDLDNYVKAIMDCGNGVLWKDDNQVVAMSALKRYGIPAIIVGFGAPNYGPFDDRREPKP